MICDHAYFAITLTMNDNSIYINVYQGDQPELTQYRVMYWKEIPVQIQVEDSKRSESHQLDPRFQQGIDAIAMFDGSAGTDEYLMGWEWSPFKDASGSVESVSSAIVEYYNRTFPLDFVSRIRDIHLTGERDSRPGSIDHWCIS